VILTIAGVIASSLVLVGGLNSSQVAVANPPAPANLPPGCSKPVGGYLIVMSRYGYNNSVLEGAGPTKAWPVITVTQNTTVNITVCNADTVEAHGFQVSNYFDSDIVAVVPGQVLHVSFAATKVGTFRIYCAIFCTIHLFMEYGELEVTA
jgi:FtsP/CotA-like multicopper oxidase with cupredoxin domain